MEAMRILMDEHQSLAAIIHAIRMMLHEIGAGRLEPDFKLFTAMVRYLDAYPEKRHHPREDRYLFEPLKARTQDGAEALARLEEEHAQAESRIAKLENALRAYTQGESNGFDAFSQAFDEYAEFYRNHMLLEEKTVLPLIRKYFTAEDWANAAAGFSSDTDPLSGTRGATSDAEFRRIYAKLVAAAPAPIGLGAGPYRED